MIGSFFPFAKTTREREISGDSRPSIEERYHSNLNYIRCIAVAVNILLNERFLLEEDADRIEHLWQKMWWFLHYTGRGGSTSFAMAAIDIALWDLKARKQKTALWRLLGGHDPKVKAYAGGIDLYFTLDELLEQTQKNLDNGFKAIKMKVGRENLSEDLERVSAMRKFLGEDFPLMVDANMGWSVDQAIRAANSLKEHNLVWLEEPTIPDEFVAP